MTCFLFYMFSLHMWGAMLVSMIRMFCHKFPSYMLEEAQRKLTIVIKNTKKCT